MEGKRNRGEVTAELSEKVWAGLCRENALVASEVWVDDARRVDFVAYRPHRPRNRSSNHAAVYSPDARGALRKRYDTSEFRQVRVAPAIELIWAMLSRKSSCETGAGFPV